MKTPKSAIRNQKLEMHDESLHPVMTLLIHHNSQSESPIRGNTLVTGLTAKRFVITVVQTLGSQILLLISHEPKLITYHLSLITSPNRWCDGPPEPIKKRRDEVPESHFCGSITLSFLCHLCRCHLSLAEPHSRSRDSHRSTLNSQRCRSP